VGARLAGGVWEGVLQGGGEAPRVAATHEGRAVPGVTVAAEGGAWLVRVPVPPEAVADGVHTVVVLDAGTGEAVATFALLAGEALAGDLRAEIDLLRAELDLLKRAFRRHCAEGGGAEAGGPPG
jgi:hypothetical protein